MDTSPLAPLAVTICVYLRMLKSSPLKILRILRAAGDPDDRMRPLSLTGAISFYRPGPGPAPFSLKGGSGEEIKSRAGPTPSLKDARWGEDERWWCLSSHLQVPVS